MMKRLCLFATIAMAAALAAGASVAVAAPTQLLTNGSFESGFTGWTTTEPAVPFRPWTAATASDPATYPFFSAPSPQDGTYDALNGFDGSSGSYTLTQQVTIPPGSDSALSWKDRLQWLIFGTLPRTVQVRILDGSSSVIATPYTFTAPADGALHDTGWQDHSVDLSTFAGQTVSVQFHFDIPEYFAGPGQAELDALSLLATQRLPTSKDECKHGGWRQFFTSTGEPLFKNQGECVSFVEHGGGQ